VCGIKLAVTGHSRVALYVESLGLLSCDSTYMGTACRVTMLCLILLPSGAPSLPVVPGFQATNIVLRVNPDTVAIEVVTKYVKI
jgi:hypothetical protein